MSARIVLTGGSGSLYKEGQCADAGGITPGNLVAESSISTQASPLNLAPLNYIQVIKNTVKGRVQAAVAVENTLVGHDLNAMYSTNDQVYWQVLKPGSRFQGLVAAGAAAINFGDYLQCDGAGGLMKVPANGNTATVTVNAGVPNGGIVGTVNDPGSGGNDYTLTINAAGTASIVVTGNDIVVTPATGAATAAAIVAQLNGNATTSDIATWTVQGTGAGAVPAIAKTQFTGGSVGGLPTNFVARQAVNNSGGATAVRIIAEVYE
jgi:hypothetical protein